MLSLRELATIRAALKYWREEMLDVETMRPYMESSSIEPLLPLEVEQLRDRFTPKRVRYAVYDPTAERLFSTSLFTAVEHVQPVIQDETLLATVILPAG